MFIIETIYPGDADNSSLDFKLVRFVRAYRAEAITNFNQEARVQGYYATNPDHDTAKSRAERADLARRMTDIEGKLAGLGLPVASIYRVGVTQSPSAAGQIDITNGSALAITLPFFPPKVPLSPYTFGTGPGANPSAPPATRPTWIDAQGSVTADFKDKEIKTEITVTFKENNIPVLKKLALVFAVGPDGTLKEISAEGKVLEIGELDVLKKKVIENFTNGIVSDVKFAVKGTATYDIAKGELETKLKSLVSFEVGIPNSKFRFNLEAGGYMKGDPKKGDDKVVPFAGISVNF